MASTSFQVANNEMTFVQKMAESTSFQVVTGPTGDASSVSSSSSSSTSSSTSSSSSSSSGPTIIPIDNGGGGGDTGGSNESGGGRRSNTRGGTGGGRHGAAPDPDSQIGDEPDTTILDRPGFVLLPSIDYVEDSSESVHPAAVEEPADRSFQRRTVVRVATLAQRSGDYIFPITFVQRSTTGGLHFSEIPETFILADQYPYFVDWKGNFVSYIDVFDKRNDYMRTVIYADDPCAPLSRWFTLLSLLIAGLIGGYISKNTDTKKLQNAWKKYIALVLPVKRKKSTARKTKRKSSSRRKTS